MTPPDGSGTRVRGLLACWGPAAGCVAADLVAAGLGAPWVVGAALATAVGVAWAARCTTRALRRTELDAAGLHAAIRARADLVAAVSHEVRTPLAMIKASADLLEEGEPGPLTPQQRVFLTTIRQQCSQVIAIAEDLLVEARIDAGKLRLDVRDVDVADLVRETARDMRPICDQRDQRVTVRTPQGARAPADARLIRQAVTNLLTNASRYTTHGGHVVVRVLDNETAVAVSVTDDGAGMSRDERAGLFGRFGVGSAGEGTGLGLFITRRIIEQHGGRILVDTRFQHGTTVLFTLPKGSPA